MCDELEFEYKDIKLFKTAKPGDKFELKYYNYLRNLICAELEFVCYVPQVTKVVFKHPDEPGRTLYFNWDAFLSIKKLN